MNNDSSNVGTKQLGLIRLTGIIIGSTIGGGVFSMAGDMAAGGANTAAVLAGWAICGVGMFGLMMCFFGLNKIKPELTNGIYSYAREGFGDFIGFNSAWGYWISALLCNVAYTTLLFAAIGYFFPIFEEGNNLLSIVCASVVIWILNFLVLRGVKEASAINIVTTIAKIIPIFVFILTVIVIRAFDPAIFMSNFWGEAGGPSFLEQIKATTGATVWAFIGVEGAVVVSARAKKSSDVGKASLIGFLGLLAIYVLTCVLSMGIMTRAELAELGNPPMAAIFESVVGPWGGALINLGVILSLVGALLGWTIIAAETPFMAAKLGVFTEAFAKENKHGSPSFSLFMTNGIIQLFLIVIFFQASTYQVFYNLSASMIMIPYLLSALYYLKVVLKKDGLENSTGSQMLAARVFSVLGTIYGFWMLYSSGVMSLLVTSILYAPGILVYIKGKKEKNQEVFGHPINLVIAIILAALAVLAIVLIAMGVYSPL
ncbi:basic amino acid/polyamine antiporter [Aminipila luticellarii]|uniref:Amino acid permease n=1 Tax=Aminipila luticellarii TaxID=2507160 RepID=A0A410PT59_9FIRM|nr:basic amino acid/polyamine antiporter [Aminipila luticellarii]QAT42152.1 amino acid permease [Aminipila luticellarii]